MAYPIVSVRMPSSLAGQQNGKLPANLLVKVGFPGRPLGQQHPLSANAWNAMAYDVKQMFGEVLTVTSTGDAYRSYDHQVQTFTTRYTTTPLPGRPTKVWNGVTYWQKPGTAMAAVPGTSNHGWGLAVDTCLWRDNNIVGITANMPMFNWLLLNAWRYGLSWESQSEPWHLRYFAGDAVPPAVQAPEPVPPTPTPTPPGDDDEVFIQLARSNGEVFAVYSNGTKIWQPNDGTLERFQGLAAMGGKDATVHVYSDLTLFAALGQVIGQLPASHDAWGNHV
jgi:LAS superfamily LD-carboxypeptidase LdcB